MSSPTARRGRDPELGVISRFKRETLLAVKAIRHSSLDRLKMLWDLLPAKVEGLVDRSGDMGLVEVGESASGTYRPFDVLESIILYKREALSPQISTPEGAAMLSDARSTSPRKPTGGSFSEDVQLETRPLLLKTLRQIRQFRVRCLKRRSVLLGKIRTFESGRKKNDKGEIRKTASAIRKFENSELRRIVELVCHIEKVQEEMDRRKRAVIASMSSDGPDAQVGELLDGAEEEEEEEGEGEVAAAVPEEAPVPVPVEPAPRPTLEDVVKEHSRPENVSFEERVFVSTKKAHEERDEVSLAHEKLRKMILRKEAKRRKAFGHYVRSMTEETRKAESSYRTSTSEDAQERLGELASTQDGLRRDVLDAEEDKRQRLLTFEQEWLGRMEDQKSSLTDFVRIQEEKVDRVLTDEANLRDKIRGDVRMLVSNFPKNFSIAQTQARHEREQAEAEALAAGEAKARAEAEAEAIAEAQVRAREEAEGEEEGEELTGEQLFPIPAQEPEAEGEQLFPIPAGQDPESDGEELAGEQLIRGDMYPDEGVEEEGDFPDEDSFSSEEEDSEEEEEEEGQS